MAQLKHPPKVFINASAIGFYGDTGSQAVDESGPAGDNFLTEIVSLWESSAQASIDAGIRTVFIRSGIVLSPQGGALAKMLMPYKFGLGGKLGNSYLQFVLGKSEFSRPMLMNTVKRVAPEEFSREVGLKRFGALIREGKIKRTEAGKFVASQEIGYQPTDLMAV